jgi:hypothetical protein
LPEIKTGFSLHAPLKRGRDCFQQRGRNIYRHGVITDISAAPNYVSEKHGSTQVIPARLIENRKQFIGVRGHYIFQGRENRAEDDFAEGDLDFAGAFDFFAAPCPWPFFLETVFFVIGRAGMVSLLIALRSFAFHLHSRPLFQQSQRRGVIEIAVAILGGHLVNLFHSLESG